MPSKQTIHQLLSEADRALRLLEDSQIGVIDRGLRQALIDLQNSLRRDYDKFSTDVESQETLRKKTARAKSLIQQTEFLLDAFRLGGSNGFSSTLQNSLIASQQDGIETAENTLTTYGDSVPFQGTFDPRTVVGAVENSGLRYSKHSEEFISRAQSIMVSALVRGASLGGVARNLAEQTGILRSKAVLITRTEILNAHDTGRRRGYQASGIEYVQRLATMDTKVCPYCAFRHGKIYKIEDAPSVLHGHDRCANMPYRPEWADEGVIDLDSFELERLKMEGLAGGSRPGPAPFERKDKTVPREYSKFELMGITREAAIRDGATPDNDKKIRQKLRAAEQALADQEWSKVSRLLEEATAMNPNPRLIERMNGIKQQLAEQGGRPITPVPVVLPPPPPVPPPIQLMPLDLTRHFDLDKIIMNKDRGADEALIKIFGNIPTPAQLAELTGMISGGSYSIRRDPSAYGAISVVLDNPTPEMTRLHRVIEKQRDGSIIIINESISLRADAPEGLGTAILARQVDRASQVGIKYLRAVAEGQAGGGNNGYYTWARLGFDAVAPPDFSRRLFQDTGIQADIRRYSDLMKTPEIREWWKNVAGRTWEGQFDLSPGSASLAHLRQYVEGRGLIYTQVPPAIPPPTIVPSVTGIDLRPQLAHEDITISKLAKVDDMMIQWFGRVLTNDELIDLFSVPAHTDIRIYWSAENQVLRSTLVRKNIGIKPTVIDGYLTRSIRKLNNGDLELGNEELVIRPDAPDGVGTALAHRQIVQAQKLNIKSIKLTAAKDAKRGLVGYYTWARLGWDAPLPKTFRFPPTFIAQMRAKGIDINTYTRISHLMQTAEGRDYWKKNGVEWTGKFNTSPTSKDWKTLSSYVEARGINYGQQAQATTSGTTPGIDGGGRPPIGPDLGATTAGGGPAPAITPPRLPVITNQVFLPIKQDEDSWEDWGEQYSGDADEETIQAIELYTDKGDRVINEWLRFGTETYSKANNVDFTDQQLGLLTSFLDTVSIKKPVLLYRGVADPSFLTSLGVGGVFQDHGFVSTSLDHELATNAAVENSLPGIIGAVIEIEAPIGTKGAFIEPYSEHPGEHEFLMQRGTRFTILEINYNDQPIVIRVQAHPPEIRPTKARTGTGSVTVPVGAGGTSGGQPPVGPRPIRPELEQTISGYHQLINSKELSALDAVEALLFEIKPEINELLRLEMFMEEVAGSSEAKLKKARQTLQENYQLLANRDKVKKPEEAAVWQAGADRLGALIPVTPPPTIPPVVIRPTPVIIPVPVPPVPTTRIIDDKKARQLLRSAEAAMVTNDHAKIKKYIDQLEGFELPTSLKARLESLKTFVGTPPAVTPPVETKADQNVKITIEKIEAAVRAGNLTPVQAAAQLTFLSNTTPGLSPESRTRLTQAIDTMKASVPPPPPEKVTGMLIGATDHILSATMSGAVDKESGEKRLTALLSDPRYKSKADQDHIRLAIEQLKKVKVDVPASKVEIEKKSFELRLKVVDGLLDPEVAIAQLTEKYAGLTSLADKAALATAIQELRGLKPVINPSLRADIDIGLGALQQGRIELSTLVSKFRQSLELAEEKQWSRATIDFLRSEIRKLQTRLDDERGVVRPQIEDEINSHLDLWSDEIIPTSEAIRRLTTLVTTYYEDISRAELLSIEKNIQSILVEDDGSESFQNKVIEELTSRYERRAEVLISNNSIPQAMRFFDGLERLTQRYPENKIIKRVRDTINKKIEEAKAGAEVVRLSFAPHETTLQTSLKKNQYKDTIRVADALLKQSNLNSAEKRRVEELRNQAVEIQTRVEADRAAGQQKALKIHPPGSEIRRQLIDRVVTTAPNTQTREEKTQFMHGRYMYRGVNNPATRSFLLRLLEVPGRELTRTQVESTGTQRKKFTGEGLRNFEDGVAAFKRLIPRTMIDHDVNIGLDWTPDGRAFYRRSVSSIFLARGTSINSVIHEIGHHVEYATPGLLEKCLEFVNRRTKNEKEVRLRDLFPTANFDANEVTKPDDFIDPYVGKTYGTATEVISTGLEEMWRDPASFAARDPEHFDLIWDVITGRI